MKPNDSHASLPSAERPFRILILSGSQRRQYNCPGMDSKSRMLMLRMAESLPKEWEIDYEDLGNISDREKIQPCNACVSTSMALCVWPCNCYSKGDKNQPDLLWNLDLYARLDMADAWAVIGPVNWYGPSTNLKLLFDRLVCMNGGNPDETLIDHKNPEKAMALEHMPQWKDISINHLEGRTAAFFCYGDEGGNEMDENGRPKILRHPHYFNPDEEPFKDMRNSYAPLVWQCRYGGVEVPDQLWDYCTSGKGRHYSDNQADDLLAENEFMRSFDGWVDRFRNFVAEKGKITPGKYRAYKFSPPGNYHIPIQADEVQTDRMARKIARQTSLQQEPTLKQVPQYDYKKSEGDKLRGR